MRKLIDWLAGWYTTLIIKYRNPGLYEFLCQEFDRENFVEVHRGIPCERLGRARLAP